MQTGSVGEKMRRVHRSERGMAAKAKKIKSARTGKYVVRAEGNGKRGSEKWVIVGKRGVPSRVVVTSPSSAAAMDRITVTHSKALKRLADK